MDEKTSLIGDLPPYLIEAPQNFDDLYKFYIEPSIQKLAYDLNMTYERLDRIIQKKELIDKELALRIRYLWQIIFGKVRIKAPKSILDKEELIPPKPPKLGLKESTEISYIDGLRDSKRGIFYFAINYRDKLPEYILPSKYDHSMDEPREDMNSFLTEFVRHKNKSFVLYEADSITFDTRLGSEVPSFRIFEMEFIDIETESLRYGFTYGQGKIIFKKGNLPFERWVNMLKKIRKWEH